MAGKIFINYRRGDEPGFAGRLFDRLEQAFQSDQLFMDVDSIAPGHDFVRVLEDQVGQCDVLLAIIGQEWIAAQDDQGRRRLDKPDDFVRIEIESGLKQGKRIIPVLINNAQMPSADLLPEPLKPLVRRHAVRLTHDRFRADAQGLIKVVETALAETEVARQAANDAEALKLQRLKEEEAAKAEQEAQAEKEQARLKAIAGLSPQDIAKAEELANWDFIKGRKDTQELRNHLARYPNGVTGRFARAALEDFIWNGLKSPDMKALDDFLAEFPDGEHASEAKPMRERLSADAKVKEAAEEQKRLEVEAWATASAAGDLVAMEAFLKKWPNGANAKAALARIKELKGGGSRFSRRTALIVGALVGGACVLMLVVSLRTPKSAKDYIDRGNTYANYDYAIVDYTKAIEIDPNNASAYIQRGKAYDYKSDYDRAIADYSKAIEMDPMNEMAYRLRAKLYYYKKDDNDRAIADFSKAIGINPNNVDSYDYRSTIYHRIGKDDRAIPDYTKWIEIDPRAAMAYVRRGDAYEKKKDYDLAIADYSKAIAIEPKDYIYNSRGIIYHYYKNDYDRAIVDYTKAIEIDPKYASANRNRGRAYLKKNQFDLAIADHTKAIEIDPKNAATYNDRAWAYFKAGNAAQGLPDAEKSLELRPNDADTLDTRASILEALGRRDESIADFRKALAQNPNLESSRDGL